MDGLLIQPVFSERLSMLYSVFGTNDTALMPLIRTELVWDLKNNSISSVATPGKC